jgi:hypothetical protein
MAENGAARVRPSGVNELIAWRLAQLLTGFNACPKAADGYWKGGPAAELRQGDVRYTQSPGRQTRL